MRILFPLLLVLLTNIELCQGGINTKNNKLGQGLEEEILLQLDKDNLGAVTHGLLGKREDDNIEIVYLDFSIENWAATALSQLNASEVLHTASNQLAKEMNEIQRFRLRQMAHTYHFEIQHPTSTTSDAADQYTHDATSNDTRSDQIESGERKKRVVSLLVGGLGGVMAYNTVTATTALGIGSAALVKADKALAETAELRKQLGELSKAVKLNTGSIIDLHKQNNLQAWQIESLFNLTEYLHARSALMPFFTAQLNSQLEGLSIAITQNIIAPGIMNQTAMIAMLSKSGQLSNTIYGTRPDLIVPMSRIMTRSIDFERLIVTFIVATPLVAETQLHVLAELHSFGSFNHNRTIFTIPTVPRYVAIPIHSTALENVQYPLMSGGCKQRASIIMCEPEALLSRPLNDMCPIPLQGKVCDVRTAHLQDRPFLKATIFGDGIVIATSCSHYQTFRVDVTNRAQATLGYHKVKSPVGLYVIPNNLQHVFCPGYSPNVGNFQVTGFGMAQSQSVIGLNMTNIELHGGMTGIELWDQKQQLFTQLSVKIVKDSKKSIQLVRSVQDSLNEHAGSSWLGGLTAPVAVLTVLAGVLVALCVCFAIKRFCCSKETNSSGAVAVAPVCTTNLMVVNNHHGNGLPTWGHGMGEMETMQMRSLMALPSAPTTQDVSDDDDSPPLYPEIN